MQWYTCQFIWDITLRCDENIQITKAPHLRFALPGTSNQMESHNMSSKQGFCNASIFGVRFFSTTVAGISQPSQWGPQ